MENLVIQNPQGRDVTTSLIVAQVFGKRNSDVLRDVRNLHCSTEFRERNFALMVKISELPQGGAQKSEYYEITKDGFSFLVMGYTGDKAGEFKEQFINEFNKREMMLKSDDYILARSQEILHNRLLLAEKQLELAQETISTQDTQLKLQAPKVKYVDDVLQSVNTYTSTQMSKELGLREAEQLHKILKEKGVMFKQSGQWMLTAKYCEHGYTKPRTHQFTRNDGSVGTSTTTVWTEKGRVFLHNMFNLKKAQETA